ncbi:tRNA:m(4)X modification enzyme TRM13 homolog [Actinia tenebrosa]|uniref:tRNA:m(4)X modification enzyme TRM13 n=1 Tax=Actinia tenebrosa TaxID=6105 RepID=A0A6P8IDU9_ACTTE|nr:tRNA:m(4)X modification enzyme TRM13 homolog [Actinia tenebrosa]
MADEVEKEVETTRCAFFMKRKNRFCKMIVGKGKKYCGEHSHLGGEDKASGRTRIPCPLDPKHTVFEDQLQKHLKCCNVTKKIDVAYYQKNINSGIPNYQLSDNEKVSLVDVSLEKVQEIIDKVKTANKEHCPKIKEEILSHTVFKDELDNDDYGISALKHLKQQASLVGHLQKLNLLNSDTVYLEFGAGRGKLSHWIQLALPNTNNTDFVLIDRASKRHKFDSCHKRSGQGPNFKRLNVDIEHLNLGKVECVCEGSRDIVAASKHLCGTATDLTLRCLFETIDKQTSLWKEKAEEEKSNEELVENSKCKRLKTSQHVKGIVVALCCHHQCYWPHYVGRPFLEKLGFTPSDFHVVCNMTSWATCGIRPTKGDNTSVDKGSEDFEHNNPKNNETDGDKEATNTGHRALGLSIAEREDIGRQCKRLIDIGRIWYLNTNGMTTNLSYYVDQSTSLENVVLLATAER